MGTKSKMCLRCGTEHKDPTKVFIVSTADHCIQSLSQRVNDLEKEIKHIQEGLRRAIPPESWTAKY